MQIPTETKSLIRKLCLFFKEKKCDAVIALDLREVNGYLSFFILATVKSSIQGRSIARDIEKQSKSMGLEKASGLKQTAREGQEWILLDYGEICIHLMTQDMRDYYSLERLWGDAPLVPWEKG